jgi:hypothetical protein
MEHISIIQELIDENRESLPTGVTTELMKQCQLVYDTGATLYRVCWTNVNVCAYTTDEGEEAKMIESTQTAIMEPKNCDGSTTRSFLEDGYLHKYLLTAKMPHVLNFGSTMLIFHSVQPYNPRKRKH